MNKFVVAFCDDETEHFYCEELYNEGYFVDYGKVLIFATQKECEKYIFDNLDSRAYDYYPKLVDDEEIKSKNEFYGKFGVIY